eukprot:scaffold12300_cov132-Isochrysis_galbana.AAC.14
MSKSRYLLIAHEAQEPRPPPPIHPTHPHQRNARACWCCASCFFAFRMRAAARGRKSDKRRAQAHSMQRAAGGGWQRAGGRAGVGGHSSGRAA